MASHPFFRRCSIFQSILKIGKKLKISFGKLQTLCCPVSFRMETIHLSPGRPVTRKMSQCTGVMVRLGLFTFQPRLILPGKMANTCKLQRGVLNSHGRKDCCAKGLAYVMVWQVRIQCIMMEATWRGVQGAGFEIWRSWVQILLPPS